MQKHPDNVNCFISTNSCVTNPPLPNKHNMLSDKNTQNNPKLALLKIIYSHHSTQLSFGGKEKFLGDRI